MNRTFRKVLIAWAIAAGVMLTVGAFIGLIAGFLVLFGETVGTIAAIVVMVFGLATLAAILDDF